MCTKLWPGPIQACGGGPSALAGWLAACCLWVRVVPRSGSVGLVWGGQHLFMALGYGNEDRCGCAGSRGFGFVLPRDMWTCPDVRLEWSSAWHYQEYSFASPWMDKEVGGT